MRTYVAQTWGWNDEAQADWFDARFDPETNDIIEAKGNPIGCISVERPGDMILIRSIEIVPEWQNRGIGSAMLKDVLGEGKRHRVPVRLQVLRVNPARSLYERLGFVTVGETETHYVMMWRPDSVA